MNSDVTHPRIADQLRVVILGYIIVLVGRWQPLTVVDDERHSTQVGIVPIWLARTVVVSAIIFGVVAVITRWRCMALLCLSCSFAAFTRRTLEYVWAWHTFDRVNILGLCTNGGLILITWGIARTAGGLTRKQANE